MTDRSTKRTSGLRAGIALFGCVTLLALPSAVLAFSTSFEPPSPEPVETTDPAAESARIARALSIHSTDTRLFPFTPAGTSSSADRSVTVAVRVDAEAAQAITVRAPVKSSSTERDVGQIRIAPTAFNLGVSRGYRNFAQSIVAENGSRPVGDLPDLRKFKLKADQNDDSRFSPRVSIDDLATGRAPRTFAGDAGAVDVGGAYRVSDNIDLTAGVRYAQERERIAPRSDGRQDSQAVYVGTEFHF
jgi:hypothetical protein